MLVCLLLLSLLATWRPARIFGGPTGVAFYAWAALSARHHRLPDRRHAGRAIQLAVVGVASAPTVSPVSRRRLYELRVLQSIDTQA